MFSQIPHESHVPRGRCEVGSGDAVFMVGYITKEEARVQETLIF